MRKIGWVVLWGLAVLLFSCEKEDNLKGSGEMVAVNISLGGVVYNGNETVTRGYVEEGETVSVALGDGLFMYTTIKKDLGEKMRAGGEALEDGVKVRVVAYQGGTVKGTGEYTVQSGVLVSNNGSGFEVEEGEYTFVAYSYNSTTSPDHSAAVVTVASPNDLLWGDNPNKTISVSENEVTITMRHLFSQVRVKAMIDDVDITNIDVVTVSPGNSADLTVASGAVAKNGSAVAAAVPILTWNDLGTPTVTSDPVVIYTATNSLYVDLGSITIDGYTEPFTNARATFNKVLEAGYSYTLLISFQRTRWAKSNIYWVSTGGNNGYLTFDTYENSHQGYQGVYFKWGSLVGISPAMTNGGYGFLSQDVPIYVPNVAGSTWEATTSTARNWTAWGSNANTSADIPYMDPERGGTDTERSNTYLIDAERNDPDTIADLRGDICQYLSTKTGVVEGNWRLPTSDDFGAYTGSSWTTSTPNADGWIRGDGDFGEDSSVGYADGTADLLTAGMNGGSNAVYGSAIGNGVVFPTSGRRYHDGGALGYVGFYGCYWSGSSNGTAESHILFFYDGGVFPHDAVIRSCALPVRCIRD
jgi:hypothetical protein